MSSTSANGIYAVSTVLPALCTVAVGLRFYARVQQKAYFQFDDWAQVPALVLYISMAVIAIVGTAKKSFGYSSPLTDPPGSAPSVIEVEKLWFALQIIQIPALALIKIAALRFYRRVFCASPAGVFYITHWVLIALVAAWMVAFLFFYIFSCGTNVWASWSGLIDFLKYCRNTETFEESFAITDFLLDTIVLFLPLPSIWRLQMPTPRKLAISGVFLLAFIGYGASIARLAVFVELTKSSLAAQPPDIQRQDTQAAWFSMLEIGFAIIALNIPSLWVLFRHVSIESMIRSFRGAFSVHSHSTSKVDRSKTWRQTGSDRSATDASRANSHHGSVFLPKTVEAYPRDGHDGVELSPTGPYTEVSSTITGAGEERLPNASDRDLVADLERGIRVERSFDQRSTRAERE